MSQSHGRAGMRWVEEQFEAIAEEHRFCIHRLHADCLGNARSIGLGRRGFATLRAAGLRRRIHQEVPYALYPPLRRLCSLGTLFTTAF